MFVLVSAIEGIPQIGNIHLIEAKSIKPDIAVAFVNELPEGATLLSELEYLATWNSGLASIDKNVIKANGLDTAPVTAEVHPDLTEITFYHADTGEPIATVPVDPATHTATLQVTATTPGVIKIRAGEPTITKLNEVVITAR